MTEKDDVGAESDHETHGYSARLLEMLESKEEQLNAVFACYGSAAQHGQLFEEALLKLIAVLNECLGIDSTAPAIRKKKTIGELLKLFKDEFVEEMDDWVSDLLDETRRRRKGLAVGGAGAWRGLMGNNDAQALQDSAGNDAASFTVEVENNSTVTGGGQNEPVEPEALTVSLESTPARHDGETHFKVRIAFGASLKEGFSYRTLRDHAVAVTGGAVKVARRVVSGENARWELEVAPSGDDAVVLTLGASPGCGETHALCTADGRRLEESVVRVAGGTATAAKRVDGSSDRWNIVIDELQARRRTGRSPHRRDCCSRGRSGGRGTGCWNGRASRPTADPAPVREDVALLDLLDVLDSGGARVR